MPAPADWSFGKASRVCAATGRGLEAGEACYSVLREEGDRLSRADYSEEAWPRVAGDRFFSYWKTRVPGPPSGDRRPREDPEALYALYRGLSETADPRQDGLRGVVALMLVRRRWLRLDGVVRGPEGDRLRLHDRRLDRTDEAPVPPPDPASSEAAEVEIRRLLEP